MKSFKHLRKLETGEKLSRKALGHCALYRRCRLGGTIDMQSLAEFHTYESLGKLPVGVNSFTEFSKINGFANGKWVLKLTQDQIIEDISAGLFTKSEFYSKSKMEKLFPFSDFSAHRYQISSWFWDKCLSGAAVY